MQSKRDGLVPIGDALCGMGGPVKALREATPQALHHFTRFDQVNQLVSAVLVQTAKGLGDNGIWRIAKLNGILYLPVVGSQTTSFFSAFAGIFASH